jgi:FMN phosphatase YigB (HAD superfamily)/predicted kinase
MIDGESGSTILLVMSGDVASGKSTVARELAERLGVTRLEADRIRLELIEGVSHGFEAEAASSRADEWVDHERHEASWEQNFARGFEDRVYAELMRQAEATLSAGRGLVLDACFPSRWWRGVAHALARRHGIPFLLVECRVDAEVQRKRLAERDGADGGNGWRVIGTLMTPRYEAVEEFAPAEHIALDTGRSIEAVLREIEPHLRLVTGEIEASTNSADLLPSPPEVVTFDCWNTLLYEGDWPVAHARRVDAVVAAIAGAGRTVPREDAAIAFDAAWSRHMDQWRVGIATGARDVAYDVVVALGVEAEAGIVENLVHHFQNASHSGRVQALDGAVETLRSLVRGGVRCALICDTGLTPGHVVRLHLARLGLLEFLEVQSFSDEAGVPKPDPRIFRAAIEALRATPGRAIHVGDLRRTDVAGARAVGMGTIRIRGLHDDRTSLPDADAVVDDHAALQAMLSRPDR